jgi:hypothetical protein
VKRRSNPTPKPGDRPWLVPTTAGAPTAAYREPQVTVIRLAGDLVTVRLPRRPGQHLHDEVTTNVANLSYTRPRPPAESRPRPPRRSAVELAPNEKEETLW